MRERKRIGLYGGTFDPVHSGHLEVARKVLELFEIDEILFIPAQLAPHKTGWPVTKAIHRYAMLALATADDPRLLISTFELDAPDRRYTVDTVTAFQLLLGDETELFFIMGADSWSEIKTWRDWERLLTLTNYIVVTRPGYDVPPAPAELKARIFFTAAVMNDTSATNIRRLASAGRYGELDQMVPASVAEYIRKYEIYRDSHEAKLNS
jgi:nicotinate-nucleotide adenylyltransferase